MTENINTTVAETIDGKSVRRVSASTETGKLKMIILPSTCGTVYGCGGSWL